MKKIKKEFAMIRKGYKEFHRICPKLLLAMVIKGMLESILPFVNIYMSALIINSIGNQRPKTIVFYVGLTVGINFLLTIAKDLFAKWVDILTSEFSDRYDMNISRKIMELDYAQIEDPEIHRKREKLDEIRSLNGGGILSLVESGQVIQSIFKIIFALSLTVTLFTSRPEGAAAPWAAWQCSPVTAAIIMLAIVVNIVIGAHFGSISTGKMYEIMNDIVPFIRIYGFYFNEYIADYHVGKDIRIYHEKPLIRQESTALMEDCTKTIHRLSKNEIHYSRYEVVSNVVLSGFMYLFIGLKAWAGAFGVGNIVQYVGSVQEFMNGIRGVVEKVAELCANNEALEAYFDFMEISTMAKKAPENPLELQEDFEIEFKNVTFRYKGNEEDTLKNINLKISSGKCISIVGENGSGKTTFIKLLCRLYEPDEGAILLNGKDVRTYDLQEYLAILSVVFQDFQLFSFSLAQNVSADTEYDLDRLKKILGDLDVDYEQLGMETSLYKDFDETGREISGGEAQKIAIARAVYKQAPIVILDEPTAALDPITEYDIFNKFHTVFKGKTIIFISHRLSACRFSDEIIVFEKGKITQRGSHDVLAADKNGKYAELWGAQSQYYV